MQKLLRREKESYMTHLAYNAFLKTFNVKVEVHGVELNAKTNDSILLRLYKRRIFTVR